MHVIIMPIAIVAAVVAPVTVHHARLPHDVIHVAMDIIRIVRDMPSPPKRTPGNDVARVIVHLLFTVSVVEILVGSRNPISNSKRNHSTRYTS